MNARGRRTQRRQEENRAAREAGRAPGWRDRDREAQALRDALAAIPAKQRRRRT